MAEMMSEKELAEIRGLAEGADLGARESLGAIEILEATRQVLPDDRELAQVIAMARCTLHVPRLLAEIERLRALLVDATEIIDTIHLTDSDDSIGSVKVDTSHGRNYLPYTAKAWLADLAKATP